jgi:hypothetical protein
MLIRSLHSAILCGLNVEAKQKTCDLSQKSESSLWLCPPQRAIGQLECNSSMMKARRDSIRNHEEPVRKSSNIQLQSRFTALLGFPGMPTRNKPAQHNMNAASTPAHCTLRF